MARLVPALAAVAAAIAMAAAPAALAQPGGAPGLEALVACEPRGTLVAFMASSEPYRIALRSAGAADGEVSFSLRVLRVAHWTAQDGDTGGSRVALDDHGAGMATVTVDRSAAGERLVEITASGARGESRAVHLLRILPASTADRDAGAHNSEPELEVLLGGVPVRRVDLAESPGIACVELRAPDAEGDAVAFSLRVRETVPLDPLAGAGMPPVLVDHGDGTATVMVDRSAAGERLVEIAASDMRGEGWDAYALGMLSADAGVRLLPREQPVPQWDAYELRVLPADAGSRPHGHAGGLPHAVEGRSTAGAPLPPRLVAQAHRQMCPDTPHTADTWGVDSHHHKDVHRLDWSVRPAMSGVPPIEGTSKQNAGIFYTDGRNPFDIGERNWWACHTRASFGTQVPQWVVLCDVPGDDRTHYYIRNDAPSDSPRSPKLINPYTGNIADFDNSPPRTYAAAQEPQWVKYNKDDVPKKSDIYRQIRPDAYVPPNQLFVKSGNHAISIHAWVDGTYSSVPELLPFSDRVVFRATAFHADDVTFHIVALKSILGAPEGRSHALVNGIPAPLNTESIWRSPDDAEIHVPVRVSDIAKGNGIYIRGINDDERTGDGVVRDLHEIELVAEIPVVVPDKHRYEPIDPAFAIEPWGCWPLLNGTAWVP